jgi:hypothetical protein
MRLTRKWRWTIIAVVMAIAVVAAVLSFYPKPSASLNDLRSIEELRTQFNHDRGAPRLVLLLSPT